MCYNFEIYFCKISEQNFVTIVLIISIISNIFLTSKVICLGFPRYFIPHFSTILLINCQFSLFSVVYALLVIPCFDLLHFHLLHDVFLNTKYLFQRFLNILSTDIQSKKYEKKTPHILKIPNSNSCSENRLVFQE